MKKSDKTEITKERILKAAIEEFGTYGYNAATVNQICQNHNIAKGLIYYNFQNKDDLYIHCAAHAVQAFTRFMKLQDIGTDLQKYMLLRYEFFRQNPYECRIIFEVLLQPPMLTAEALRPIKADFDNFNLSLYRKALRSLELRDGVTEQDAIQYYNLLQNMLNGYLGRTDITGSQFQFAVEQHEQQLENILHFMLYGIVKEPKIESTVRKEKKIENKQ